MVPQDESKAAAGNVKVLALLAAGEVSGPTRGLFQLIELSKDAGVQFVIGMFLVPGWATTGSIEEGKRRGFQVEILSQRWRYDPRLIAQAWKIVRRRRIEILQSHGYKPTLLAWFLKWSTGHPWVAFAHGQTRENRRVAFYNRLEFWVLKRADRVVVVSEATGRILVKAGVPEKIIRVIRNAIDPYNHDVSEDGSHLRQLCHADPGDLLIGVIGRMSPEKGQEVFLHAFTKVVKVIWGARAVLVGAGQDMESLKELVHINGLKERVTFTGYQTNTTAVYAGLDLVVIPSFSEGLPNVLLEAMAHRKAVVATNVGGIPEVMQDGLSKFLVPPGDAQAMADAIVKILGDAPLRKELGEIGARHVGKAFSPLKRTKQIVELYKELLGTE